eukprot:7367853-Pyramimonas_sp.AAC.1
MPGVVDWLRHDKCPHQISQDTTLVCIRLDWFVLMAAQSAFRGFSVGVFIAGMPYREAGEHRPEDLLFVARHLRGDTGENGGAEEVALLVARHLDAAPIKHAFGAHVDPGLDERLRAHHGRLADHWTQVRALLEAAVHLKLGRLLLDQIHQLYRVTHQHGGADGHAPLPGRA